MTTYLIAEITVTDAALYERYKPLAARAIAQAGGSYVVRGGAAETLEGSAPERLVVIAFPTKEAAHAFYHGEAYREAREIRARATRSRVVIVEGV